MSMKLTGGEAAGAKLFGLKGRDTRPAQARVRNSLFNILQHAIPEARVLDLFAGTGSVGLEALSRGAASCVFVDQGRECIDVIRRNLEKLRWLDRARLVQGSVFRLDTYLQGPEAVFDLVFIDPPYEFYRKEPSRKSLAEAVRRLIDDGRLAPQGRVIMENPTGLALAGSELPGLARTDQRQYHQTELTFFGRK